MKKIIMLLSIAFLMSMAQLSAAPKGHINDTNSANAMYIKYASVDWVNEQLVIGGYGFPADYMSLVVMMGDDKLTVIEIDGEGDIVAEIPEHLMETDGFAGDVLLVVTNNEKPVKTASFMLTIGAVGPQGEKGNVGDTGPMGTQGEQGVKGDAGPVGDTGLTGLAGPQGEQGETGPAGPGSISPIYTYKWDEGEGDIKCNNQEGNAGKAVGGGAFCSDDEHLQYSRPYLDGSGWEASCGRMSVTNDYDSWGFHTGNKLTRSPSPPVEIYVICVK